MRMNTLASGILAFTAAMVCYWLGDGTFYRGLELGLGATISTTFAALAMTVVSNRNAQKEIAKRLENNEAHY